MTNKIVLDLPETLAEPPAITVEPVQVIIEAPAAREYDVRVVERDERGLIKHFKITPA